jgi:hypothetical protein
MPSRRSISVSAIAMVQNGASARHVAARQNV